MKYFSAFSGIGGFELGIEGADMNAEFVGYSEIDKYATAVYRYHWRGAKNYGDITKIDANKLPDFGCLVGGFPCQAFSVAGKRRGFEDTRGTLFFDLARILQAKKPRLFVFENVKGLLSHDNGRTIRTILSTLNELGYNVQWQVVNSKNHGVPQNRERIILVGHLRGERRPQVFPLPRENRQATKPIKQLVGGQQGERLHDVNGCGATLTSSHRGMGCVPTPSGVARTQRVCGRGSITPKHSFDIVAVPRAIPVLTLERLKKRQMGRRFKTNGEPAFTLTAQDQNGVYDGVGIRRLTPVECERLQGFPDDWTKYGLFDDVIKEISDTQRYKMCGNAVTTNVIEDVFRRLNA